jgi:type I restriction enzyme, S subunit
MSAEWRQVSLKEVTSVLGDGLHGTPEYDPNGDHFFINGNNLSNGKIVFNDTTKRVSAVEAAKHRKNLTSRTILVSINGTLGNVAFYAGEKVVLGKSACYFNVMDSVDKNFIRYVLDSEIFQGYIQNLATGSTIKNVSLKLMRDFQFSLPPFDLQQRISGVLACLDDRITLLRETNATLEGIAQALFKSWFVDFDPVRAKMQGRAPEGMDEATAALFPDSLEESALGLVPKGWRISTVGDSFVLTMGQSPPGDTYSDDGNGLPFYQGRTDFGFRFPTKRMYCSAPTRIAEIGDTLVSVRAPVGDVNMAIEKCCVGRGVASVRHPKDYRSFTFYAMRGLGAHFENFDSEGTIFGSINKKDFQALPVIAPTLPALTAYDAVSSPIDAKIVENEEQIRTLATLRDTLLPRLISGALRMDAAV